LANDLPHPEKTAATQWEQAFRHAVDHADRSSVPIRLYLEHREDLTVESITGEPVRSTRTAWSGVSATRLGTCPRFLYQSDPALEDLERIAQLARDDRLRHPEREKEGTRPTPEVEGPREADASSPLATVMERVGAAAPDAELRGRAVAFEQTARVGGSGAEYAADHRRGLRIRLEAGLRRGASSSQAVFEAVRPSTASGFEEKRLEKMALALAERLESRLDAREAPSGGEYPVVLAPGVGGVLIHEIVGHALEADTVLGGGSWLAKLSADVAPRDLVILDDPRRGRAAWRVDDEGCRSRPTPLIGEGRVTGWLHDSASAAASGRRPTGHGRRSSFREAVKPRMGCTFIAAGRCDADEVLSGLDKGVYIRRMEAASIDLASGRAVFRVTDSDLVKHGRIERPLLAHLLVVDGKRALEQIDRVADDLEFDTCVGSCHRDGQPLAISVGAPTIRIGVSWVVA
jgi:TldD protein